MTKAVERLLVVPVGAALLLLSLGAVLGAFIVGGPSTDVVALRLHSERIALLQGRAELQAERTELDSQLSQVTLALATERAARTELENTLAGVQAALGQSQDQLAFFENLLPPGPQGALDIRAIEVHQQADSLRYRVLLTQSGKAKKRFLGALRFIATVRCKDEAQTCEQQLVLQPLLAQLPEAAEILPKNLAQETTYQAQDQAQACSGEASRARPERVSGPFALDFAQFQRSQGWLEIPARVVLKSVTVQVLEGAIVLASKVVAL
ncbi:MAG: hypothetical protein HQ450_16610 [Alcaligenaceae bacterium]|nr:hypothetical protein [Alcaligenaceae bacterium]